MMAALVPYSHLILTTIEYINLSNIKTFRKQKKENLYIKCELQLLKLKISWELPISK